MSETKSLFDDIVDKAFEKKSIEREQINRKENI
jgi:hypothetical protein